MSGYSISHPEPGEEVYVTGIAGYFPESNSVAELQENLFNKVNMVTEDDRRWPYGITEAPHGIGKIRNIDYFDASFFGINYEEAHHMDPMSRLLLERTYEALFDAGMNPEELRSTKTGVFIGTYIFESELNLRYNTLNVNNNGISGPSRSCLATRISQWLGVTGPAYSVDTACSSAAFALEMGFKAIRRGECDSAIICGSHICLHVAASVQFNRLGILSPDCKCKSFDESADGYGRSETVAVCVLQKAKDARRVYAQIIHAKTNCDGYKDNGVTYPSGDMQMELLKQVYSECMIDPNTVEYVEAHGTGTAVGDFEELKTVQTFISKERSKPLLLGCIKSNIGHSEAASGMGSLAKLCIAYHSGYIAPNLNLCKPHKVIADFVNEGKLKIVTEKQSWDRGLASFSGFGFGGANVHVLFKNVAQEKVNGGRPQDDMPRLICVSGRTKSAVEYILNSLQAKPIDVEEIRLLHAIHEHNINGHPFRGYALLHSTPSGSVTLSRSIQRYSKIGHPICLVFSGKRLDARVAEGLMKIPSFAAAIDKSHNALLDKDINLKKLIADPNLTYDNVPSYISTIVIQIALFEVLKTVGIIPDYYVGFDSGEICCAYTNGLLSMEQAVNVAYYYGLEMNTDTSASIATAEIKYEKIVSMCPPEKHVVPCSSPTTNISGNAFVMENFLNEVKARGVETNEVTRNEAKISQNGKNGRSLLSYLQEIIKNPKQLPQEWLMIPKKVNKYNGAFTAEKFYNCLMDSRGTLQENILPLVPACAITINVGRVDETNTNDIKLFTIQENDGPNFKNEMRISFLDDNRENALHDMFNGLGRLYEAGVNLKLANIYPIVPFPVSQGTPMLSHLVEWKHQGNWHRITSANFVNKCEEIERVVKISREDPNCDYLKGHMIGGKDFEERFSFLYKNSEVWDDNDEFSTIPGRNLYPGTGYLCLAWETLASSMGLGYQRVSVVFENVVFHRATTIPNNGELLFNICIQPITGEFEITESNTIVATGIIYTKKNISEHFAQLPSPSQDSDTDANRITQKDFYKKIRLRGYQYSGMFRGVLSCDVDGYHSRVSWPSSTFWDVYMDYILQTMIVSIDTRHLYVPIGFDKISIDTDLHYEVLRKSGGTTIDIHYDKHAHVSRSGGVEIRGLRTSLISKRPDMNAPVCETYNFIPNISDNVMKSKEAICINIQVIIENIPSFKYKVIEIMDEEYKRNNYKPLLIEVSHNLSKVPQVWADLILLTEETIELPSDISVMKKITAGDKAVLLIGVNLLQRHEIVKENEDHLLNDGFILSIENVEPDLQIDLEEFYMITSYKTDINYIILLRKKQNLKKKVFVNVDNTDSTFSWVDIGKKKIEEGNKVVFYGQSDLSGVLGLVNCLRRETGGTMIHGLLITDPKAPAFDENIEFYKKQLEKDLAINVFQDGQWGTYRHLLINELEVMKPVEHAYSDVKTIGDLSSFKWFEGCHYVDTDETLYGIHVHSASLNFRDVVVASGRVPVNAVSRGRLRQQYIQGLEIAGRSSNGARVAGSVYCQGISTIVYNTTDFFFCIPDEWSMDEAATIPVAYCTTYLAFAVLGKLKHGESVLIHAGTGAVGQAAIYVAFSYNCEIFTTVGSPEKRDFIKKLFPQLKDSHIASTRDTSFEEMINRETNGRGVDLVLNSLSDDKLLASIRCLGHRGRFLELGKYDIFRNTKIDMYLHEKEISFHGVMFDYITEDGNLERNLLKYVLKGIIQGAVQPITYCTFEKDEVETANRYMAAGKHTGKVIIKIREEERLKKPVPILINAISRYLCSKEKVYVLIGGLGGFGLELADWLVLRGAKKLVFASIRGVTTGYQARRIRTWETYGCKVAISTEDVTTATGCTNMLKFSNSIGHVEAIFNLAVVLKDASFQQQTPETFMASFKPKAIATGLLDTISRELCPELRQFVVFSSMTCGRGNASQSNYGMANSVMERICEKRKREGFPGLAIQFGAIGDVGLLSDMQVDERDIQIGGTVAQQIASCLQELDKFLALGAPIASSYVLSEKRGAGSKAKTALEAVANLMGIKNVKTVSHQTKLAELGMDSMLGVEIKQTLERDFEIILTPDEVRSLSFARLVELSNQQQLKLQSNLQLSESDTTIIDKEPENVQIDTSAADKKIENLQNDTSVTDNMPENHNDSSATNKESENQQKYTSTTNNEPENLQNDTSATDKNPENLQSNTSATDEECNTQKNDTSTADKKLRALI